MNYERTNEFKKDLKRLGKRYSTLESDLKNFEKVASEYPQGVGRHATVLRREGDTAIVKSRLFCRALVGSSMRITYAHHESTQRIVYIQLYYKGDQAREDEQRIKDYLS